jgi:hypothetical protein
MEPNGGFDPSKSSLGWDEKAVPPEAGCHTDSQIIYALVGAKEDDP